MIHTVNDFYNKAAQDIKNNYFPELDPLSPSKEYREAKYAIELFNNGCTTYRKLISCLSKHCKAGSIPIHAIIKKHIVSFGEYKYRPTKH